MTLLLPLFLWSLLALIPLVAVYLLKVRPRTRTTPAYFLWEKVFSSNRATSLFSRLRDLLSLMLMALAFSAMVLALCRPELKEDDRKDLLILVDHSASMGAQSWLGSRLDAARQSARDIAIALNGKQRAAVATIGRELAYRSNLSASPNQLLKAIDGIEQSDFPFSNAPLTAINRDAQLFENYRIILISDGSFTGVADLPEKIELVKIGKPTENLGIVGADLQQLPDGRMGFYYQLASTFKENTKADLLLKLADTGEIKKLIPLEVQPGVNEPEVFFLDEALPGKWIAEIDLDDAFDTDNKAWLAVPPKRPVKVAVKAENRFFFEQAIVAFELGGGLLQLVDESPEIVVEQGQPSATNDLTIIFAPEGASPWWTSVGEQRDYVAPRELIQDHPVLRLVDLSGIAFLGAREITPAQGSLVLVKSEDGNPLVFQSTRDGQTALIVNLDPLASELYFSAWFPVIVQSAARHLAGRTDSLAPVYRPGDVVSVPGFREDTETTLLAPESEMPVSVKSANFGPLPRRGFFEFDNPSGNWPVASSLLTQSESLLDNELVEETVLPLSRGNAPSYWLLVLALMLLVAESILYHRRKVG